MRFFHALVCLVAVISFSACTKTPAPPAPQPPVDIIPDPNVIDADLTIEIQDASKLTQLESEILTQIQTTKKVNFKQVSEAIKDTQLRALETVKTYADGKTADVYLGEVRTKITVNVKTDDLHSFKVDTETKLEEALGKEIEYKRAANNIHDILDSYGQCHSFTMNYQLSLRSLHNGSEFVAKEPVIIIEQGHVLSGYMMKSEVNEKWYLYGVDHVYAGRAEKVYGPADQLHELMKKDANGNLVQVTDALGRTMTVAHPVRVIQANDFMIAEIFEDLMTPAGRDTLRSQALKRAADKYGIVLEKAEDRVKLIHQEAAADDLVKGEKLLNRSIFAFGYSIDTDAFDGPRPKKDVVAQYGERHPVKGKGEVKVVPPAPMFKDEAEMVTFASEDDGAVIVADANNAMIFKGKDGSLGEQVMLKLVDANPIVANYSNDNSPKVTEGQIIDLGDSNGVEIDGVLFYKDARHIGYDEKENPIKKLYLARDYAVFTLQIEAPPAQFFTSNQREMNAVVDIAYYRTEIEIESWETGKVKGVVTEPSKFKEDEYVTFSQIKTAEDYDSFYSLYYYGEGEEEDSEKVLAIEMAGTWEPFLRQKIFFQHKSQGVTHPSYEPAANRVYNWVIKGDFPLPAPAPENKVEPSDLEEGV